MHKKIELIHQIKTYDQDVIELDVTHELVFDEVRLSRALGNFDFNFQGYVNILHKGYCDIITNGK